MDNTYKLNMISYENLYRGNRDQAEKEFDKHGGHTRQECIYYQKALDACARMADMSVGEERDYHRKKMRELNDIISDIKREISGTEYRKEDAPDVRSSSAGSGSSGDSAEDKSDEFAETVKSWYADKPKHGFDDVAGMHVLKDRLKACLAAVELDSIYKYLKIKPINSFFFVGPPGSGKTYIVDAFAHELMKEGFNYLKVTGSSILSKYVGDAEKLTERFFDEAIKCAPCIAFVDEIDGICRDRSGENVPFYASSITTSFLTGYNKINSSDKKIIFLGATNYPNRVDHAMLDRVEVIRVDLPDHDSRSAAFRRAFVDRKEFEENGSVQKIDVPLVQYEGVSDDDMAAATEGYNYRDISRLVDRIKIILIDKALSSGSFSNEKDAIETLRNGRIKMSQEVFDKAMSEVKPVSKEEDIRMLDEWQHKFVEDFGRE